MDPHNNEGVTIVQQPFDMNLFLQHQVDSASAMTYNELAQVLESKNPKTGKLFTLSDLNVLKMQNVGTGMLEDGLFSTGKWLKEHDEPGDRRASSSRRRSRAGSTAATTRPSASTSRCRTARRCRRATRPGR